MGNCYAACHADFEETLEMLAARGDYLPKISRRVSSRMIFRIWENISARRLWRVMLDT